MRLVPIAPGTRVRLRNRDVEKLYAMLRVGDIVQIRAERDEEVAAVFGGVSDVATTARYSRGSTDKIAEVMRLRNAKREAV